MKYNIKIKPSGDQEVEVTERSEGENCNNILQVTAGLGKQTRDERTGPDCDEQVEVNKN